MKRSVLPGGLPAIADPLPAEPDWRVLSEGGTTTPEAVRRKPPTLSRAIGMFAIGSLIALTGTLILVGIVVRQAAVTEALRDARAATDTVAVTVIQPALTDGLVSADPQAVRALDTVVRGLILPRRVVRVKVWDEDGRILYSDDARLGGQRFTLPDEELESLQTGQTRAEITDLNRTENQYENGSGSLLEVYRPVRTPGGHTLLYEQYLPIALVDERSNEVWRMFAPIIVGAALLLQVCQLPLVWALVRRLRAAAAEREALLGRVVAASDEERKRLAGDLHDGIVQGLAGASFTIAGTVGAVDRAGLPRTADDLRDAAGGLRDSIRGLRSMLVEMYPPSLAAEGLLPALRDLAAPLVARGITVTVDLPEPSGDDTDPDGLGLRSEDAALIFRVAQESLRNVARHSGAGRASLHLSAEQGCCVLEVSDEGAGMAVDAALHGDGHLGLSILRDLAEERGARLAIASQPGAGTRVRLEVRT